MKLTYSCYDFEGQSLYSIFLQIDTTFEFYPEANEEHNNNSSVSSKKYGVIGASLSEPHTSVTAFAEVVCLYVCLRPYTVNFK